jgi:hypothetical protein
MLRILQTHRSKTTAHIADPYMPTEAIHSEFQTQRANRSCTYWRPIHPTEAAHIPDPIETAEAARIAEAKRHQKLHICISDPESHQKLHILQTLIANRSCTYSRPIEPTEAAQIPDP